jgi:hypothetical protein
MFLFCLLKTLFGVIALQEQKLKLATTMLSLEIARSAVSSAHGISKRTKEN